jgi:TolA-binding protein
MKIHTATAGMLCLAILTTGACVTRSTYDDAVADLVATKAELDSTGTQSQVLTEQVSELQQVNIDRARQMEAAWSALQRAKQQMESEHTALQERLRKLNRTLRQLTAQQNNLQYVLKRATEEQVRLQTIVSGYKSNLGEADGPGVPPFPPPSAHTNKRPAETALTPPAQGTAQTDPTPQPTVTTPAASADQTAANPKPQPANNQTSKPVEDNWLSMLKGWAISLWRSIFS